MKKSRLLGVVLFCVLASCISAGAVASIVTVSVEGSNPSGGAGHTLTSTDTISFSFTYDSTLPETTSGTTSSSWWDTEITSTGTVAGHAISATKEQISIFYSELGYSFDQIVFQHNSNGGDAEGYDTFSSGIWTNIGFISLTLADATGTVFDSVTDGRVLPETLSPTDFNNKLIWLRLRDNEFNYTDVSWQVDTVSVSTVPVPGAIWLFGSGLIGLIGIARRKKSA